MIAILTGVLLALVHPGFGFTALAPFSLAPLFYFALYSERLLLYGWVTGFVYWFAVCYWIQTTLQEHGGMSAFESWALFLLFCAVKALQTAAFCIVAKYLLRNRGLRLPWYAAPTLAALWTALEWTHNYTGFAWLTLGNAALSFTYLAKLAPYTGVWGLSFALALVSSVLVTRQWRWLTLFGVLLFLPALPTSTSGPLTAHIVQPNIEEETVWSAESTAALQRHLTQLSRVAESAGPATLTVWPEVPAPLYDSDRFLSAIPPLTGSPLLAGVVAHSAHGAPLNSALLLSKEGRFVSRYDKVNLVPFGEFVPWPFEALTRKVSSEAGEFAPGSGAVVAHGIGTFICYESVFPNYIRQFAQHGAAVLFNLSNDSWFGKSAARDQHFLITRMRAVENRRWIVRVTNNGITASIDPAGQVHDRQPDYQEVTATLHYGEEHSVTLYTRWGDWFVYLCLAVLMFAAASAISPSVRQRRAGRAETPAPTKP